jgi:hypothetical protein
MPSFFSETDAREALSMKRYSIRKGHDHEKHPERRKLFQIDEFSGQQEIP